jgi:hypothetical protein
MVRVVMRAAQLVCAALTGLALPATMAAAATSGSVYSVCPYGDSVLLGSVADVTLRR